MKGLKILNSKCFLVLLSSLMFLFCSSVFAATEYNVNRTRAKDQINSAIAADNNGGYLAVWEDHSGNKSDVYMRRLKSNGKPTGPEVNLTLGYNCDSYNPGVAFSGNNYLVVWAQTYPEKCIRGVFVARDGLVGTDFIIEDYVFMGNPEEVKVTSSAGGNYFVVYNVAYHYKDIFGKVIDYQGNVGPRIHITDYNSGYASDISVASNNVSYLVAWRHEISGYVSISARWFDLDGYTLTDQTVITSESNYQHPVELGGAAAVGAYYYFIVWDKKDLATGESVIEGQCIDQAGGVVQPQTEILQISTNNGREVETDPAIAADSNYYLYVTWDGEDRRWDSGIFCQIIRLTGEKIGPELRVNNATIRKQTNSQVASFPNSDKAVVVWESNCRPFKRFDIKSLLIDRTIITPKASK